MIINNLKIKNEKLTSEEITTATKIAQKRVSGKAVEWSLDREGSKNVWEVTISKNGQKSEVKINAITKKVISVERD